MSKEKKEGNPVKEVAIFGIGFGLILGMGAYGILVGLKNTPDIWGMKRNIALGIPLVIISAIHLFSGISLIVTKAKWGVICSIISAFITSALYLGFEISTMGFFRGKLISLIIYSLPILLIIRGRKAFSYIDKTKDKTKSQ